MSRLTLVFQANWFPCVDMEYVGFHSGSLVAYRSYKTK